MCMVFGVVCLQLVDYYGVYVLVQFVYVVGVGDDFGVEE